MIIDCISIKLFGFRISLAQNLWFALSYNEKELLYNVFITYLHSIQCIVTALYGNKYHFN